jgi:hypothetical protein
MSTKVHKRVVLGPKIAPSHRLEVCCLPDHVWNTQLSLVMQTTWSLKQLLTLSIYIYIYIYICMYIYHCRNWIANEAEVLGALWWMQKRKKKQKFEYFHCMSHVACLFSRDLIYSTWIFHVESRVWLNRKTLLPGRDKASLDIQVEMQSTVWMLPAVRASSAQAKSTEASTYYFAV